MPIQKMILNCDVEGMMKAKTAQRDFTWQNKQTNTWLLKHYLDNSYVAKLVECTVLMDKKQLLKFRRATTNKIETLLDE